MPDNGRKSNRHDRDDGRMRNRLWVFLPLLLLFVSVTSFLAGTHIGRTGEYRLGQMLDTIVLSPEGETVNLSKIDFSGQIFYSDGTPCADRTIEIHSTPRRTTTDSEGVFHFKNVETGEHRLAVLDDTGLLESEIAIVIARDRSVKTGQVYGRIDGYELKISEQVMELHIQVRLDGRNGMSIEPEVYIRSRGQDYYTDSSGKKAEQFTEKNREKEKTPESGEELLDNGNIQEIKKNKAGENSAPQENADSFLPNQQADTSHKPEEPAQEQESAEASKEAGETGTQESKEAEKGGGSGSSGGRPVKPDPEEPSRDPLPVEVQEKDGPLWSQNTLISLFADKTGSGKDEKLMPGSRGSYEFQVRNNNSYAITYKMLLSAPEDQLLLPLRYRLKSEGHYLCEDSGAWLTAEQLSAASITLEPESEKGYLLEWNWLYEGGDDELDTKIGTAKNPEYRVIITIVIEQIVSQGDFQ